MQIQPISQNRSKYSQNTTDSTYNMPCQFVLKKSENDTFENMSSTQYKPSFCGLSFNKLFSALVPEKWKRQKAIQETLRMNKTLNTETINTLKKQIVENPELKTILGRCIKEDNGEFLQFMTDAVKKYPQLKEKITFLSNLPANFIINQNESFNIEKNQKIFLKLKEISKNNPKADAISTFLDKGETVNWADIVPEKLTSQKANMIIDCLYDMAGSRQRLDSRKYPDWQGWAKLAKITTDFATLEIQSGRSFHDVLNGIAKNYHFSFSKSKNEYGTLRTIGTMITPYDNCTYVEYKPKFDSLIRIKRKSPFKDMDLTQIDSTVSNRRPVQALIHPSAETVYPALGHAHEHYNNIIPLIKKKAAGQKLSLDELKYADEEIATIHYILANALPYRRGTAGITGILTRALNNAIGIKNSGTKKNIALDLEAFCRSLDNYKKNWSSFFEVYPSY